MDTTATVTESFFLKRLVDDHVKNLLGIRKRKSVILMHGTAVLCAQIVFVIRRFVGDRKVFVSLWLSMSACSVCICMTIFESVCECLFFWL